MGVLQEGKVGKGHYGDLYFQQYRRLDSFKKNSSGEKKQEEKRKKKEHQIKYNVKLF